LGLVYYLAPTDESYLDTREHVPNHFTKEVLLAQFWPSENMGEAPFNSATKYRIDVGAKNPEKIDVLVYINRLMTTDDLPRDEYIVRMNEGISDALKAGVPEEYVDEVIRKFIPK
jgi:gamma-glutamylcyclotransferase